MMAIGIDPGKTIGLVLYDGARVIAAEQCSIAEDAVQWAASWRMQHAEAIVAIEWPRMYGVGGNEIADTCAQAGWLWARLGGMRLPSEGTCSGMRVLTRVEVVSALSRRMGQQVRGDAGVWAAMLELHGGKGIADRKAGKADAGGPLGLLAGKPHAKASLAVAFVASRG